MTTRIPAAEITGFYGALIKKFSAKMFGKVPESLGVMWHNQPVLKASMGFGQKLQKWNSCDESLKSYAHMAVASFIGCTWCLDYNYFMAHNHSLDLEKARQIPCWRESDVFTPLEQDVLEYAEAMRTGYKYKRRVTLSYNEARMTPLTDPQQVVLESSMELRPRD